MNVACPIVALLLPIALTACDQPKPRPQAAAAAAAAAVAAADTGAPPPPAAGTKAGRRLEMAVFSLDMINEAADPLNTPAKIQAGVPTTFSGFGFDPVARASGKAIDIVVDGVAYGTTCCQPREDVAAYYKTQAVLNSGFRVTLPAGTIKPGRHVAIVRVVSADGKGFYDSATLNFEAR